MDYFKEDLYNLIHSYAKLKSKIPDFQIKVFSYQMLRGINYIHKLNIVHRDIKPHNVLVDKRTNYLIICDFGSAKQIIKGEPNISYICSRCYRAPELIFGATQYHGYIDVWSIGCVIAEMINGEPFFLGESNLD